MSGIFTSPKKQKVPIQAPVVSEVSVVEEDAAEARRRERKKLQAGGSASTRLSGIESAINMALKRRLGE